MIRQPSMAKLARSSVRWAGIAVVSGIAIVIGTFYYYVVSTSPLLGRLDPGGAEAGYEQVAARAQEEMAKTGATWIATVDYRTYAELRWQLKDRVPVIQINERSRFLDFKDPGMMQMNDRVFAVALLSGVWCVAIVGIVLKLFLPGRFDRLSVGLYLAMGWSGVLAYDSVVTSLPKLTLWFIAAGGALYTLGVIFHTWRRLRFQNAIWHSFVLLGAACHYTAVLDLVLT